MKLLVSIVTANLNQAEFLERCILSVLNQSYPQVEYIVVDGGSTDNSLEIIRRYSNSLSFWHVGRDNGPADAYQRAFEKASGSIFGFLNADDLLLPWAVEEAVTAFRKYPEADVIYGDAYIVDREDRVVRTFVSSAILEPRLFALGGLTIAQQAAFWKKEAFDRVGGFNVGNRTCWDAELWIDLALAGARFRRVPRVWACFRHHPGSISGSGRLAALYVQDRERIFRKVFGRNPNWWDRVLAVPAAKALGKVLPPRRLYARWLGRGLVVSDLTRGREYWRRTHNV